MHHKTNVLNAPRYQLKTFVAPAAPEGVDQTLAKTLSTPTETLAQFEIIIQKAISPGAVQHKIETLETSGEHLFTLITNKLSKAPVVIDRIFIKRLTT